MRLVAGYLCCGGEAICRRVAQQFENGILRCRVRRLLHLQMISRRRAAAKPRGGYMPCWRPDTNVKCQ